MPLLLIILAVSVAVLASFSPVLWNGFLGWDDADAILKNPHLQSLSLENLRWMWTTFHMGPYQPLAWMSLAVDYRIWGPRAAGFHLTSLLWHTGSSVLLLLCLRKLLEKSSVYVLGMATLFWAIHPLRVESVAWATERRDVLSGFFVLVAWHLYLHQRKGVLTAFLFGLLSKATAAGLVWVMLLGDFLEKILTPRQCLAWVRGKSFFIGLAAVFAAIGVWGLEQQGVFFRSYALIDRLGFFFYSATFYLQKALWPEALSPLYAMPLDVTRMRPEFFVRGLTWVTLCAVCFRARHSSPLLWKAWWAFHLILLPVSGLTQHGRQLAADRYTYLSFLPLSVVLADLLRRYRSPLVGAAGLVGVILLGSLTFRYSRLWKNDVLLWSHAVAVEPESALALYNQGTAYLRHGDPLSARAALLSARDLWPHDSAIRDNLIAAATAGANDALHESRYNDAVMLSAEAWQMRPESALLRFHHGVCLMAAGRSKGGRRQIQKALRQDPSLKEQIPPPFRKDFS